MKNKKDNTNKDILVSSVIEKEKKCNNKSIIVILSIVVVVLAIILLYLMFTKESCDEHKCSSVTVKEVEVDPKYQLINYNGFRFKMPLEWDFINSDNKYEIADKDDKLYIFFNTIDVDYQMFDSGEYQKDFLENIQTSGDIKIDNVKEKEDDNKKYYLYEGKYNDYDYLIVVIGNNDKTILINAKFIDKISYNELKEEVINFALTAI